MIPLPNAQPAEGKVESDGWELDIVDVFQTVQGEGTFAGFPATFVRLAGCNMSKSCVSCDTDYTTNRRVVTIGEIIDTIKPLAVPVFDGRRHPLVVLTGGEPLRQNISRLIRELVLNDFTVQIETNGTLFQQDVPWLSPNLFTVCSPKGAFVHPDLLKHVTAYKYPIRAGWVDCCDGLPSLMLGGTTRPPRPCGRSPVYVLPEDDRDPETNAENRKAALKSAMQFGYVFQMQLHKEIGLP